MLSPNDPALKTWVHVPSESDFPLQNLPFGIFKPQREDARAGVAIGDSILDLYELTQLDYFEQSYIKDRSVFGQPYLNDFIALGKPVWQYVRQRISHLLQATTAQLRDNKSHCSRVLVPAAEVQMQLPVKVGDYTDFYSSMEHATNVGSMFRDPANALLPNWKHLPVGYHGRASSIVVSGTSFHRPNGQYKAPEATAPSFGPSRQLDFELETAFIVGQSTQLGEVIPVTKAADYIFGMVLFNDWSARDIQAWEYVPLGPFLGKNFASSVSPWIITLDALEPFKTAGPTQEPQVLPYLQVDGIHNYDINLSVSIRADKGTDNLICHSNTKYLYWNIAQQLAHHTVNGCNINIGDMYASGTISGPTQDSYGSMLELTWRGTKPLSLADSSERKFLHDHDTIIMRGYGQRNGVRVGFGEVTGKVLPAKQV
jgi:fumarylacetoacetase